VGTLERNSTDGDLGAEPVTRDDLECALKGELFGVIGGQGPADHHEALDFFNLEVTDPAVG
jgi:hypothetical protein